MNILGVILLALGVVWGLFCWVVWFTSYMGLWAFIKKNPYHILALFVLIINGICLIANGTF